MPLINIRLHFSIIYYLGTFSSELFNFKSAMQSVVLQPVLNTILLFIFFGSFGLTATHVSQNSVIKQMEKH